MVINNKKCIKCGNCIVLCPVNAISLNKGGIKINNKCVHYNLCKSVCPILTKVDAPNVHKEFFLGLTKSTIQYNKSTSGGVLSELAYYLLRKKIVDGIICTKIVNNKPVSFIAKNRQDLLDASGSKYVFCSPNLVLKKLDSHKKYAFIGLPCHIKALFLAQKKGFYKNVIYKFGLFCNHNIPDFSWSLLFKILGVKKEDIKKIIYRTKTIPSNFEIHLKNNNILRYPWHLVWNFVSYFWASGCKSCKDTYSIFADISFGDNWSNNKISTKYESLIIINNPALKSILEKLPIILKKAGIETLIESQGKVDIMKSKRIRFFDRIKSFFLALISIIKLKNY